MANCVKNEMGKKLYIHYNNEDTELIAFISDNVYTEIKVVSYYIGEKKQEIYRTEFTSFKEMCRHYNISSDTDKYWEGNSSIDGLEENFKFKIELVENIDTFRDTTSTEDTIDEHTKLEDSTVELTTTYVDRDTYSTKLPPINISDESMKKHAEYISEYSKKSEPIKVTIEEKEYETIKKNNFTTYMNNNSEDVDTVIFKSETVNNIKRALSNNFCITLSGTTGLGKSYLVEQLLKELECEVYRIKAHKNLTNGHLTLNQKVVGGKVLTFEGPVAEALRRQNEDKLFVIWIDESNHCSMHDVMGSLWEWCNKKCGKIDILENGEMVSRPNNLKFIFTENPIELVTEPASLASIRRFHRISLNVDDIDIEKLKEISKCPNIVNRWLEINNIITKNRNEVTYEELSEFQIGPCIILENLADNEIESYEIFKNNVREYIKHISSMLIRFDVDVNKLYEVLNTEL